MSVLVVDDRHGDKLLMQLALEREGLKVRSASSAAEALAKCYESRPEVILTDIAMPGIDGVKLIEMLKADERFREVPIVVLTGVPTDSPMLERVRELGVVAILSKPVIVESLAQVIRAQLAGLHEDVGE